MRWWFACFGLWGASVAAQAAWFTVAGNPADASVDSVQVDPVAIMVAGERRTMNLRVSRSQDRANWEGVPYRSYEARVAFNCRAKKAEYRFVRFYMAPLWQGEAHKTTDYSDNPRPMRFRDMVPNPTDRIIRAACIVAA
ncbi:surface-adhesin E family protein [Variovorax sp. PBL-H6]|uniref:surface-adhesin E family protein n=1 Tax=Variovorax sp. PBL-H6 TaxID=434009 RepID=UPI001E6324FE|nr:surface-adhesin E family protein [Variovorax sp. PBL-H6]